MSKGHYRPSGVGIYRRETISGTLNTKDGIGGEGTGLEV